METNNSDQKEKTFQVKQRTFSITDAGKKKTILRTGNIGPCVAFYGRHKDKKVVFMSHVDGNICGYSELEKELKLLTNESLEGFSLYATTNYTLSLRIIILGLCALSLLTCLCKGDDFGLIIFLAALFLTLLYFSFASLILVFCFSRRFKNSRFEFQTPCRPYGWRVTVAIDATTEASPAPSKESIKKEESKKLYGLEPGHCWLLGQKYKRAR